MIALSIGGNSNDRNYSPRHEKALNATWQGTALAPEGGPMAMTMFYLLNGMGVSFLMYVLVHFWSEERLVKRDGEEHRMDYLRRDNPMVLVVTHSDSQSAQDTRSVIPLPVQQSGMRGKRQDPRSVDTAEVICMKRFPTR
jgi:hypothetical protein